MSTRLGDDVNADEGDSAGSTRLSPALSTGLQVASQKYFLVFDINETLIHYTLEKIMGGKKRMKKCECRARLGLQEFLNLCVDCGFEICFWSCVMENNLLPCLNFILEKVPPSSWEKVPRLPEDCLKFGQSMCKESSYRDPASPNKPFLLKPLSRLFQCSPQLQERGATEENTLLIDDTPYKNVLNNPFNAFHPPTCTMYLETKLKKGRKPFLQQVLQPLLFKLRSFGQYVPDFLRPTRILGSSELCRVTQCTKSTRS